MKSTHLAVNDFIVVGTALCEETNDSTSPISKALHSFLVVLTIGLLKLHKTPVLVS